MSCPVTLLYVRTYVHSTEDVDKVLQALKTVVSGGYVMRSIYGHYRNPIQIIEVKLHDWEALEALKTIVSRLDDVEYVLLLSGVEGNRLYVKFDKQHAYRGVLKISQSDDVIYVELRTRSLVVKDITQFLNSIRKDISG